MDLEDFLIHQRQWLDCVAKLTEKAISGQNILAKRRKYSCKKKNTAAEDKIWSGSRNIWVQAPKKPLQTFICLWMHPSIQLIVESF